MNTKAYGKADFLYQMQFLLSFRYSDSECKNILSDYEEWFQEESWSGKSEAEICADMGRPIEVVKKITAQTQSEASKFSILIHHRFLQFMALTGIRIFADLSVFYDCEKNGLQYFYAALFLNMIYFVCAMAAVKNKTSFHLLCGKHFMIAAFAAIALAGNLAVWNYAEKASTGPNAVFALTIVIWILYAAIVLQGGWGVMKNEAASYMLALHATGAASMLLYGIRQYHTFTMDRKQFVRISLTGSVGIYLEILVFVIVFWLWKAHTKGAHSWMHN